MIPVASAVGRVSVRAAAQTTINEAALACALARFRLARGQFPETLEALAPHFVAALPKDVLTGESYKYFRTEDGKMNCCHPCAICRKRVESFLGG